MADDLCISYSFKQFYTFIVDGRRDIHLNAVHNLSCMNAHTRPDTCSQTVVVGERFHTTL